MIPWKRRLELYPKQHDAIYGPEHDAVIEASPKSGKTIGSLQWLIDETERVGGPHRRFLWVAPAYGQAKIAFRRAYLEVLDTDELRVHKTDHTITLPNGSVLYFGSGDRPDLIYGEDYWALVVDEGSRLSEDAWVAAQSTLNHTNGRIRIIGNKGKRAHWFARHIKAVRKGLAGWTYAKLTQQDAIDAGVVTPEADQRARDRLPGAVYRFLYLLEDTDDGAIEIAIGRLGRDPVPDMVIEARGWDLATTEGGDWTVGARLAASGEGWWITDMVRERFQPGGVYDLIAETAGADGPGVDQIVEEEKGASGALTVEAVRRELRTVRTAGMVHRAPVENNKIIRAYDMVAKIEQGRYNLALPPEQEIVLLDEMELWPFSGPFDDQVDGLAHAHNHLADRVMGMVGSGYTPGG